MTEPATNPEPARPGICMSCGPGYRYGDDGCNHTASQFPEVPEPAPQLVCGYEATGEPIGPHDVTGQGRCVCEPAPAPAADTGFVGEIPTVEVIRAADTGEADDDTPLDRAIAEAARGGSPAPLADPREQQLVEDLTPWLPALKDAAAEAAGGYVDCAIPNRPAAASPGTADGDEPPDGAFVLGFEDGNVWGAWHRRDNSKGTPRRWFSTYINGDFPSTWAEAVGHGARWEHSLHTSPTPDAYDRACAALEKHRERADLAEAALAARDAEVRLLNGLLAAAACAAQLAEQEADARRYEHFTAKDGPS